MPSLICKCIEYEARAAQRLLARVLRRQMKKVMVLRFHHVDAIYLEHQIQMITHRRVKGAAQLNVDAMLERLDDVDDVALDLPCQSSLLVGS